MSIQGNYLHEVFQSDLGVDGGWGNRWQDFYPSFAGEEIIESQTGEVLEDDLDLYHLLN